MAKTEYDFTNMIEYLNREFISPNECIIVLEQIESALLEAENIIILNPALSRAIRVQSKIIEHLNDAIPEHRKEKRN